MRYGVALRELVDGSTDDALRALDAFAKRSRMPDLVPVWVRNWTTKTDYWHLDRRLVAGIRERGAVPVLLVESTGMRYEHIHARFLDTSLRLLALRAEGCVFRWDQEPMSKGLAADWYRHPLYVETFRYVSRVMRDEADVRLAYCTTSDVDAMAEFYPGDACQVVGFDAFSRTENGRFPPEQWAKPTAELQRIAPGKPVWVFESGRSMGLSKRATWLRSIAGTDVDVAITWDMDVPDSADDFSWTPAMDKAYKGMVA